MKRSIAVALIFIAVGMIIMMLISNVFLGILFVLLCLLVSFNLYCE